MWWHNLSDDLRSDEQSANYTISGSTVATSHDLTYLYEGEKPDAASRIGEDRHTYDDNGNLTLIVSDSTTRTITWDEENRMVMLNDDGYVSRYTYDFSGPRVIKSHGPQESVYINGAEQDLDYHDADWFFFHTDHLGSTSYLTDTAGNVSQFVCYTPYGEAIVDEHLTTYENPFKFSGKELDDITGLYDHGARSRNPISTLCMELTSYLKNIWTSALITTVRGIR